MRALDAKVIRQEFMIIIGEDDLNLIACHQPGQQQQQEPRTGFELDKPIATDTPNFHGSYFVLCTVIFSALAHRLLQVGHTLALPSQSDLVGRGSKCWKTNVNNLKSFPVWF
ncbi:hypothetical protein WN944_005108 [Citrus x changshan-huyou]|uniref:Uncharacterized protein n=1 Tax=Citrus x changshan-huyou TaxID=2935761 RepID=A0AAP0QMS9_9ROSI